jgi:alkylhydroperoxidase family enzyme
LNGCAYCLAAHTYLGKHVSKFDDAEMMANRNGASHDLKADAAVKFAVATVRERGHVSDAELDAVRRAGFNDSEIVEIVLHVALNTLTNYINAVAKTDVDFAVVVPPITSP